MPGIHLSAHTQQVLATVLRDGERLQQAGHWREAVERCRAALEAHASINQSSSEAVRVMKLAGDIAGLIGISHGIVATIASDVLLETPVDIVARELATILQDIETQT